MPTELCRQVDKQEHQMLCFLMWRCSLEVRYLNGSPEQCTPPLLQFPHYLYSLPAQSGSLPLSDLVWSWPIKQSHLSKKWSTTGIYLPSLSSMMTITSLGVVMLTLESSLISMTEKSSVSSTVESFMMFTVEHIRLVPMSNVRVSKTAV